MQRNIFLRLNNLRSSINTKASLHLCGIQPMYVKSLKSNRQPILHDPLKLVRASSCDLPRIIEHLRSNYLQDEPLLRAVGLIGPNPVYEEFVQKQLDEGISLLAVPASDDKRCLGMIINHTTCPWDADRTDMFAECVTCKASRRLLHFLAHIKREPALHERYSTLKVFELGMLSVDSSVRRNGIAERLCRQSLYLAKDLGYRVARLDCTNQFMTEMAEKLGMKLAWEMAYSSYLDAQHEPMIRPEHPHTHIRVYVEDLKRAGQTKEDFNKFYKLNRNNMAYLK